MDCHDFLLSQKGSQWRQWQMYFYKTIAVFADVFQMKRGLKFGGFFAVVAFVLVINAHENPPSISNLRKSYDVINLNKAYQNNPNISGAGVGVGIIDSGFNSAHPSLANKLLDSQNNFSFTSGNYGTAADEAIRDALRHGSHVAAILLGAKLGDAYPHGVAYGASFYGIGALNPATAYAADPYAFLRGKVKVVNASLNVNVYPAIERILLDQQNDTYYLPYDTYPPALVVNSYAQQDPISAAIIQLSRDGAFAAVATGNEGMASPGVMATYAGYDETLRGIVAVGAVDGTSIIRQADGSLKISGRACADGDIGCSAEYSNAFVGAELYGIVAPGSKMDAANAFYSGTTGYSASENAAITRDRAGNGIREFISMDGTSMATPVVSGAAALVAQKFPFLSGAQIADTLLSTANKTYKTDRVYVKTTQEVIGGQPSVSYSVVYIKDSKTAADPVPRDASGVDLMQVAVDLVAQGYDQNVALDIVFGLLSDSVGMGGVAAHPYEGVYALTREEMFGQGILDVDKALRGVAILDANRLSAGDVATIEGVSTATYTINTAGYNAEFSNDIAQRKWDDALHLRDAQNSPKNALNNKDVGLVKAGDGELILSGVLSYKGATKIAGGALRVRGESGKFGVAGDNAVALTSGKITESKVVVDAAGTLFLENAYAARGVVSSGAVEIINNARVDADMRLNGGRLNLTKGANLYLGESAARGSLNLSGGAVLQGNASIFGDLNNNGGSVYAGFLADDETMSAGQALKIAGSYTQSNAADSKLYIAFDGASSGGASAANAANATNTNLLAQTYTINGGSLIYKPLFSTRALQATNRLKDGQTLRLNLGDLEAKIGDFSSVSVESTNTLNLMLEADKLTLNAAIKEGAYVPAETENLGLGSVLESIQNLPNLAPEYDAFFGHIDANLSPAQFQESLSSVENNAYLDALESGFNAAQASAVKHLNFLLSAPPRISRVRSASLTPAPVQAPLSPTPAPAQILQNPAQNAVQIPQNQNAQIPAQIPQNPTQNPAQIPQNPQPQIAPQASTHKSRIQMLASADASILKHQRYKGRQYAASAAVRLSGERANLLLFGEYGTRSFSGKATLDAQFQSIGAGASAVLKEIGNLGLEVFGAAQLSSASNKTSRQILHAPAALPAIQGSFKTKILSAQGGLAFALNVGAFSLKPLAAFGYTRLTQGEFSESGGLFSKTYRAGGGHIYTIHAGANFGADFRLSSAHALSLRAFFMHARNLNYELKNEAVFSDFPNLPFSQKTALSRQSTHFGATAALSFFPYFAAFGYSQELADFHKLYALTAHLGLVF